MDDAVSELFEPTLDFLEHSKINFFGTNITLMGIITFVFLAILGFAFIRMVFRLTSY